jgi:hypothetical protein
MFAEQPQGESAMSTSIIDGTVEEAVPGRRRGAITVFKSIRFALADGSSRTVTKAVVRQPLADEIAPGAQGRFYLFNAFDLKGIHGLRTPDGREVHAFPTSNQKLFLILGLLNFAWILFRLFVVDGQIPLLGVALLILAAVGWYFMGKGAAEAQAQFEGDAGYSGTSGAQLT